MACMYVCMYYVHAYMYVIGHIYMYMYVYTCMYMYLTPLNLPTALWGGPFPGLSCSENSILPCLTTGTEEEEWTEFVSEVGTDWETKSSWVSCLCFLGECEIAGEKEVEEGCSF